MSYCARPRSHRAVDDRRLDHHPACRRQRFVSVATTVIVAVQSSFERLELDNAPLTAGAFNVEIGDPCGESTDQCDFGGHLEAYLSWQVGLDRLQIGNERDLGTDDNMTVFLAAEYRPSR